MHYLPRFRDGDRGVALKSSTNCRVAIFDKARNQYLRCESLAEANVVLCLMADKDVVDIETQVAVEFEREDGPTTQFVDIRVTYRNGLKKLLAVRPVELDKSGRLKADVELIREQVLHLYAHVIEIVDETIVTEGLVYRSCAILRARDLRNSAHVARMKDLAKGERLVKVFDLLHEFGDLGLGWIAMWNLIDDGVLEHECVDPDNIVLTHISMVRSCV